MDFSNFNDELREKSKNIHDKSDRLVQLKLAVALTDIRLYQQVLCDFHCIFYSIEQGVVKNLSKSFLNNLWREELERTKLFENDLVFYAGLDWKSVLHPSSAALDYASHINDIAKNDPILLISYIHTMYLAIFSGGHILRRIIKKTLGISGPDGLEIFDLPDGCSRIEIKNHIKETINSLDLDRSTKDRLVQEKISIFERNNTIVSSIQPSLRSFSRIFKFFAIIAVAVFCFYLLRRN